MSPLSVALYAIGLPALVVLALGGAGRLRAAAALIAAFSAANFALIGGLSWPPVGAMARLPLLAPLALLALTRRSWLGALGAVALGGLSLQQALQHRSGLTVGVALAALALGGAGAVATAPARRGWFLPALLLLVSLLLAGSGSLTVGQAALALATAMAAARLRGGQAEEAAILLGIALLTFGVLLAELASPSAALAGAALLLRARETVALSLAASACGLQMAFELLIPDIATAG